MPQRSPADSLRQSGAGGPSGGGSPTQIGKEQSQFHADARLREQLNSALELTGQGCAVSSAASAVRLRPRSPGASRPRDPARDPVAGGLAPRLGASST